MFFYSLPALWEYLKTTAGKAYAKISRWNADATDTFMDKSLSEVREEFEIMGIASETITFVATGCLTGSTATYTGGGWLLLGVMLWCPPG